MRWAREIGPALNLRAAEGERASLLLLHSFLTGASVVFFETTARALFLSSFDTTSVPYVYLAAAVIVPLAGIAFSKLEQRLSCSTLFLATAGFLLAAMLGFRIALACTSSRWPALGLLIWVEALSVLSTLQFWGLAGRLFDLRQGKRLFGLIGAGEVAASVIGGFSVPALVGAVGTPNLLLLAAGSMALNLVVLLVITRKFSTQIDASHVDLDAEGQQGMSVGGILKNPYLRLMLLVSLLAVIAFFLVDYVFYDRVESRFPDENALAGFFGVFAAVVGIINLAARSFVSGRVIGRFGLAVGLLTLPVALLAAGGVLSVVGAAVGMVAAVFWIAIASKALDIVLRDSIDGPSFLILYQPLPSALRLRAQTFMQSIVEPLAGGLAGIGLIFATRVLSLDAVHLAWVLLAVVLLWIVAAVLLRRQYLVSLMGALANRTLGRGGKLTSVDASAVKLFESRLGSPHSGEVLYALEMLEQIEHPSLQKYLVRLLEHPSEAVRENVLERLSRLHDSASFEAVRGRLHAESSPRVRGAALRALALLGETDALELVEPYLDSSEAAIRKGALVGLLRGCGIEGILLAGERVTRLVTSSEPADRKFVSEVLGEVGIASFHRPVAALLADDDDGVRRAAVVAAGKLRNPRLWPLVIANLSRPLVRQTAATALVSGGPEAAESLKKAFDEPGQSRGVRMRIARICGRIGGERATAFLRSHLGFPDEEVSHQVLLGLSACGYVATGEEAATVAEMIRKEAQDTAWNLAGMADLGGGAEFCLLSSALVGEARRDRERMMTLLSFICPRDAIVRATACLTSESAEQRAYAIEVLDNVVSADLKPLLFAILEDIPDADRLARLEVAFPQERLGAAGRLQEILRRPPELISPWTQACVLHAIGRMGLGQLRDPAMVATAAPSPLLRETAVWALGQLAPDDLADRLRTASTDRNSTVAGMARFVLESMGAGPEPARVALDDTAEVEAIATLLLDPRAPRAHRARAAAQLASRRGPGARAALLNGISLDDEVIRSAVLHALKRGLFPLDDAQRRYVLEHLRDELVDAEKTLTATQPFIACGGFDAVVEALERELDYNRERILLMAALATGQGPIEAAFYRFAGDRRVPAQVEQHLEVLLQALPDKDTRERVSFLIQCRDLRRLLRVWSRPGDASRGVAVALTELAVGSPGWVRPWTRVCALRAFVRLRLVERAPDILHALEDADAMVRETALWALAELAPGLLSGVARELANDPSPLVATTARRLTRN